MCCHELFNADGIQLVRPPLTHSLTFAPFPFSLLSHYSLITPSFPNPQRQQLGMPAAATNNGIGFATAGAADTADLFSLDPTAAEMATSSRKRRKRNRELRRQQRKQLQAGNVAGSSAAEAICIE